MKDEPTYEDDRHQLLMHWYYGQYGADMPEHYVKIPDFIREPLIRMCERWEGEAGGINAVISHQNRLEGK